MYIYCVFIYSESTLNSLWHIELFLKKVIILLHEDQQNYKIDMYFI